MYDPLELPNGCHHTSVLNIFCPAATSAANGVNVVHDSLLPEAPNICSHSHLRTPSCPSLIFLHHVLAGASAAHHLFFITGDNSELAFTPGPENDHGLVSIS